MKRVLVVDDDDQFRNLLTRTLRRAGYDVIEAVDGRMGLEQVDHNPVDLVITPLCQQSCRVI